MTSKVYLALQDNDTSRYIIEAIEQDNPDATIQYLPAMIRVESTTGLVIRAETVSKKTRTRLGYSRVTTEYDHAGWQRR